MGEQPISPVPLTPAPTAQTKTATMSFPQAMQAVINGKKVRRRSWDIISDYGLLKDGWLTIFTKGTFYTWKVNDGDMEALDWEIVTVAS